jgi:mono/diheme cytochrome c family protein
MRMKMLFKILGGLLLLRTGIRRDGKYTPPWMPKLNRIADEDILSIIAFLRSDDSLVQASSEPDRESEPSFLVKFLTHVAFKKFRYPDHKIVPPDSNDKVALGRYLALEAFDCFACHSGDFKKGEEPDARFGRPGHRHRDVWLVTARHRRGRGRSHPGQAGLPRRFLLPDVDRESIVIQALDEDAVFSGHHPGGGIRASYRLRAPTRKPLKPSPYPTAEKHLAEMGSKNLFPSP